MERLTINEKIKRENEAVIEISSEMTERAIGMLDVSEYRKRIEEHKQLAEWLEKLAEYEDLEEQGKLLKLPCNIGDFVFFINKYELIELYKIVSFNVDIDGVYCASSRRFCRIDDFGKTVFLTREEAEAALKKL